MLEVLEVQRPDRPAALRAPLDEAFARQAQERLAHRRAAHPRPRGELVFRQGRARQQPEVEDVVLQLVVHRVRETRAVFRPGVSDHVASLSAIPIPIANPASISQPDEWPMAASARAADPARSRAPQASASISSCSGSKLSPCARSANSAALTAWLRPTASSARFSATAR